MQNRATEFDIREDTLEQNQQVQRMVIRILPYWPIIVLAILLGVLGARIYLRYATKIYAIKARIIVNDDSQQKSANLIDIVQLDTRNLSTETEKEMEILRSRNLIRKLAENLQLNVQYGSRGYIKSGQNYKNVPFKLELEEPDSVSKNISGNVQIEGDKIRFNKILYPCDTVIESYFGNIKWHINHTDANTPEHNDWYVRIEPMSTAVNQIQESLTVEPISKQSSILDITYEDEIPERGWNILTTLLSLYGSTTVDYKSKQSENTLLFLDERLKLLSGDLSDIEKKLEDFKTNNDIVDLSSQGSVILDQLKDLDTKISELDVQADVLNKIKEYVTRRNNSNNQIPATLGIDDPVLIDLLNQLYQAEFDLQKVQETSGSKNPRINVLQETIDKLKPSILASINNLQSANKVSRQRLQSSSDKLGGLLGKMPLKERQLLDISRQQGIKNGIYTFLLQKREEQAITAAGIVPNYRIIDRPEESGLVKPQALRVYIWYVLLALVLVALYIYFREFLSTRVKFRTQIESRTKVPVLSEIVFHRIKTDSPIVVEEGKRTLVAEEFRELRTNLNYITFDSKEGGKVILVTSSIPNEGKSFIAINTSISLSLTGNKVALLEFDLRKPKISKELGIKRNVGLSTYLIGKSSESDIIHPHPGVPDFSIIPSGPVPPNPSELISSSRLNELFDYLRKHFDFIIIDSPPIGSVTDAKILATVADATLYIVRQNFTNSSFIELINDVKERKMLPNLNIVFNGIKVKKIPGYKYGTGYNYYGYSYGNGYGYADDEQQKPWWKFWKRDN